MATNGNAAANAEPVQNNNKATDIKLNFLAKKRRKKVKVSKSSFGLAIWIMQDGIDVTAADRTVLYSILKIPIFQSNLFPKV